MCDNKTYQYNVFSLYRSEEKKETEIHFLVYKDKVPVLVQICREVIFLLEKILRIFVVSIYTNRNYDYYIMIYIIILYYNYHCFYPTDV